MEKVVSLKLRNLTNAGHYDFMGIYLKNQLEKAPQVIKTAIAPVYPAFLTNVAREFALLEWMRASTLTADIKEADRSLDKTIRAISAQIKASLLSIHPDIVDAAMRVKQMVDSYGYLPKMRYEEEVANATALLSHLKTDRNADAIKIGLKSWISVLEGNLILFNALYAQRNEEQSKKPDGTFRTIRADVDTDYRIIISLLEVGTIGPDPAPFITLILRINEEISRINAHYAPPARINIAACEPDRIPDQVETGDPLTPCIPAVYYPFPEERINVRIEEHTVNQQEKDRVKVNKRGVITRMERLIMGRDYNLTYRNNIKPGTGVAIIHGKGRFKGKYEQIFNILPYGSDVAGDEGNCSCGCCPRCLERASTV